MVDDPAASDEGRFVTRDDIEELDSSLIRRTGVLARTAGVALVVVGVVGLAAWMWLVVRQQLRANDGAAFTFDDQEGTVDLAGRIDIVVTTLGYAINAAMAVAVGMGLQLVSSFLLVRAGGSLTSFEVGDPFPDTENE